MATVLSIGQCGFDDARLGRLLGDLGAQLQSAASAHAARALLGERSYDLVLVNRVFDATSEPGVAFIREARQAGVQIPMMLVSDYPEAQAEAVTCGARPGFGKRQLREPAVLEMLKDALGSVSA
jgi:CheY-like chemotaxis protein